MPDETITLPDLEAWDEFAKTNRDALEEQYGSVEKALQHAREGGLMLGGGAAPLFFVTFEA